MGSTIKVSQEIKVWQVLFFHDASSFPGPGQQEEVGKHGEDSFERNHIEDIDTAQQFLAKDHDSKKKTLKRKKAEIQHYVSLPPHVSSSISFLSFNSLHTKSYPLQRFESPGKETKRASYKHFRRLRGLIKCLIYCTGGTSKCRLHACHQRALMQLLL